MLHATGFDASDGEFHAQVEAIAEGFLFETGDSWGIALDLAEEHKSALALGEAGESQTSGDLFEISAADLGVSYELACAVIALLARGVVEGMDRRQFF